MNRANANTANNSTEGYLLKLKELKKDLLSGINNTHDKKALIVSSLLINILSLALPIMTLQVYDRILAYSNVATLSVLTAGVFIAVILDFILKVCRSHIIGWSGASYEHSLNCSSIKHLLNSNITEYSKKRPGEYLQDLSAIGKLREFYSGQSIITAIDLPFVLVFIALIFWLSQSLALIPIILILVFAILSIKIGKKLKKSLENRSDFDDHKFSFILEALSGIHTVKSLGLEPQMMQRYRNLQHQSTISSKDVINYSTLAYNSGSLFTQIMMISMIAVGSLYVLQGNISMGTLVACVLLSGRIMQPVHRSLSMWTRFQEFKLAKEQIQDLYNIPSLEENPVEDVYPRRGELSIKNLTQKNNDGNGKVLDNINLRLLPGDIISISGPPGEGKSVLLEIIAGLYPPHNGSVLVDNLAPHLYPPDIKNHYVGYLPPSAVIFNGTILENLTLFRPELESMAKKTSKLLGLDSAISKLPMGYNTVLKGGAADPVPPGIKQRIAITRILVQKPKLILFDRCDRSLDKEGYNYLFKLIGRLKNHATIILVSEDRNILRLAEDEYVLEDGKLIRKPYEHDSKLYHINPYKELQI